VEEQLSLGFAHEPASGRADFLPGRANREALGLIEAWPDWPARGLLLVGPAGSGKSHLAAIWCANAGAPRIEAARLGMADADRLSASPAASVEDLHAGPLDEAALFHMLNLAVERGTRLLLTSRLPPRGLGLTLPDLESRLRAMRIARLGAPDDELLRQVLTKLFADRQIAVDQAVIAFIATRMERSFAAAGEVVARLDRAALAAGRAVTRRLAGEVLAGMEGAQTSLWPDGEP
jgi:chromosomal replication initiation ATPase DnaA